MSYREEEAGSGCLFHGYARWYAAAAGCLIPLSNLPILEDAGPASSDFGEPGSSLWDLARQDQQGGLAAVSAYLLIGLFVLLVATSIRPAPRSGRRVVVIAVIAALLAAMLVATPGTDGPLTGWGEVAAAILILTAVLAADHALHLIRHRRRERLESARNRAERGTSER